MGRRKDLRYFSSVTFLPAFPTACHIVRDKSSPSFVASRQRNAVFIFSGYYTEPEKRLLYSHKTQQRSCVVPAFIIQIQNFVQEKQWAKSDTPKGNILRRSFSRWQIFRDRSYAQGRDSRSPNETGVPYELRMTVKKATQRLDDAPHKERRSDRLTRALFDPCGNFYFAYSAADAGVKRLTVETFPYHRTSFNPGLQPSRI